MLFRFILFFSLFFLSISSLAGGEASGGTNARKAVRAAIKQLVLSAELKTSMINYLESIPLSEVKNNNLKALLERLTFKSIIQADILTRNNYKFATSDKYCKDAYGARSMVSAVFNDVRGDVCFDLELLTDKLFSLSDEERMIRLASLTLHEHVHHFQIFDNSKIPSLEAEADLISGYVLLTARFAMIPSLEWVPVAGDENDYTEIHKLNRKLKHMEVQFLSGKERHFNSFPDLKNSTTGGVVRIMPYENQIETTFSGGGSQYSFFHLTHKMDVLSDFQFLNGTIQFGRGGCNYGLVYSLGDVEFDAVDNLVLNVMSSYRPPFENEPIVRVEQRLARTGISIDGYTFKESEKVKLGHTYLARSIVYSDSDLLVAFKVIEVMEDGSIYLAWKLLKEFPAHKCRRAGGI